MLLLYYNLLTYLKIDDLSMTLTLFLMDLFSNVEAEFAAGLKIVNLFEKYCFDMNSKNILMIDQPMGSSFGIVNCEGVECWDGRLNDKEN